MASSERDTEVFIVRLTRVPREIEGAASQWRGVIEHLASGERQYLKDADGVSAFIQARLPGIPTKLNWWRRVRRLFWERTTPSDTIS